MHVSASGRSSWQPGPADGEVGGDAGARHRAATRRGTRRTLSYHRRAVVEGVVDWDIVGRAAERARLQAAWSSVGAGRARVVVVGGEAGMGKTALERLPAHDRRAVMLAAHGYRGPEIAALIGGSDGAMRTRLHRARLRLRAELVAAGTG